jgi:LemA protein
MIITIGIAILCLILIIIIGLFITIYNKFQRLNNGAEAGLSQIKVALKKRLDMISQLAEVVKGYAKFEKNVMENITKMRSLVSQDIATKEIDKINGESKSILERILAVVENYPDLKASKNFIDLMNAIKDVEGEISRQRYTYNNIVQEYNTKLDVIPSNFVAKLLSYKRLEYLKFEKEVDNKPDMGLNN